jgi:hypothetical protein
VGGRDGDVEIEETLVPHVKRTGSFLAVASALHAASHSVSVLRPKVLVRHATPGSALSRTEQ